MVGSAGGICRVQRRLEQSLHASVGVLAPKFCSLTGHLFPALILFQDRHHANILLKGCMLLFVHCGQMEKDAAAGFTDHVSVRDLLSTPQIETPDA